MLWSPGYGGYTSAVLVNEVSPSVEHPAVVEGHEGVSGCGGCVLSVLSVCVLQRGELVLSEHLIHNKLPVRNTDIPSAHRQTEDWHDNGAAARDW